MYKKSLFALMLWASSATAEVLTTLKPLGFIANAITDGVTETKVLLPTSASPHDYSLKPSDLKQLQSAQLVVWVGDEMESFLAKSIEKLPKEKVLTLEQIPAISTSVKQFAEPEEPHQHQEEDEHHHNQDWHIWLSPEMSLVIAEQIAERLRQQMPEQAVSIEQNFAKFKQELTAKQAQLKQQLSPIKSKGYYTFHQAYGYFEHAFDLNSLGAFTLNPSIPPGAKTLQKIKQHIGQNQAVCLFAEPQITPKVVEVLRKNTGVAVGELDPLGAKIALQPTAYVDFLQSLANQFQHCLSQ